MSSTLNSIKQFLLVLSVIGVTACGGGGGGSSSGSSGVGHSSPVSAGNDVTQPSVVTDKTPVTTSQNDTPSETSTSPSQADSSTPNDTIGENTDTPADTDILNDPVFSSSETLQEDNSLVDATSADDPSAQVPATVNGYADLSWYIPDSREDGTYLPVYEISGYEVRYSADNGATYKTIKINDAQTSDWRVENLAPGTYQFSIATIDTDGVHSQYSVSISKQIL